MSEITHITGRQIAAGRALAGLGQDDLAKAANISVPTLRRMEASAGPATGLMNNVAAVQRALEAVGVIFVVENGEGPGVRMRKAPSARAIIAKGAEARGRAKTAIDEALAGVDAGHEEKASRKRKLTSVAKELKTPDTIAIDDLNASNDE